MLNIFLFAATCFVMIFGVLFFPKIKLGKIRLDSYWVVALIGAAAVLVFGDVNVTAIWKQLIANTAVNPVKILVLFLSMAILSVFLDELGFFRFLAGFALRHTHGGQTKLFFSLYFTIAVLTVFTSNDIIILSFTPFLCYFAKEAEIDPVPYLAAEFVAANTWSMALIIGNPTNIYLSTRFGIDFFSYLGVSILPTLAAGGVSLLLLWLLFRKRLKKPVTGTPIREEIEDKLSLGVGIAHLAVCTVLLAISSYIGWEMWIIALASAGSIVLFSGILSACRKSKPKALLGCLKHTPWQLAPFLLSMFVITEVLSQQGVTAAVGNFLGTNFSVPVYGALSFLTSNLINNIPMTVLFAPMIEASGAGAGAVFATVVGSNLGAFFTPVGALAGLMFGSILSEHGVKFGYLDFLKLGVTVALPTLAAALGVLMGVLLI